MADPGAGIDVVVGEGGADQLLHQIGFLVGAARGRDAADGEAAVLGLDALELAGGVGQGFFPGDFAPGIVDVPADHRRLHALRVGRVAPGETALDAGVAGVGATRLVRHHAHDLLALDLGAEGAADAAIGAGGDDARLRLAGGDQGFCREGGGRAGGNAGAAGHAFGTEETIGGTGHHGRLEAAAADGEGESALDLHAGPDTTAADDALGRVEAEVGVRFIFRGGVGGIEMVVAGQPVTDFAQADDAGHVLQFAVAVARAGQAVQRMVGDVKLHDPLAQLGQAGRLGADLHAFLDRRRARCRKAAPAFDLHQAEAAGTEGFELLCGAELGDGDAGRGGGPQHRGAGGGGDVSAVDGQGDGLFCAAGGGAEIEGGLAVAGHRGLSPQALALNWHGVPLLRRRCLFVTAVCRA